MSVQHLSSTPAHFTSSMSLAASGSKVKAQKMMNLADGRRDSASSSACSSYLALLKRAVFGTKAHHHALARVQVAGARCRQTAPGSTSSSANFSICPPWPRMPVLSSSSRQPCWRLVAPLRAMAKSASRADGVVLDCLSNESTVGKRAPLPP